MKLHVHEFGFRASFLSLALLPTVLQRADSRGTPCFPASPPDPGTCFLRSSNRENFGENKKMMTFNEVFTNKRRIAAKAIKMGLKFGHIQRVPIRGSQRDVVYLG
jgi:hypothetical protein